MKENNKEIKTNPEFEQLAKPFRELMNTVKSSEPSKLTKWREFANAIRTSNIDSRIRTLVRTTHFMLRYKDCGLKQDRHS